VACFVVLFKFIDGREGASSAVRNAALDLVACFVVKFELSSGRESASSTVWNVALNLMERFVVLFQLTIGCESSSSAVRLGALNFVLQFVVILQPGNSREPIVADVALEGVLFEDVIKFAASLGEGSEAAIALEVVSILDMIMVLKCRVV
jgi:hypothetical protein